MQDASNLLNINAKWSLGFYCQHRVKWNLNCSKLFKCGVTQCDNVPAQEQLLVNTIFTLIEAQDAELEARVITGLTKYRNMVATGTGQGGHTMVTMVMPWPPSPQHDPSYPAGEIVSKFPI